MKITTSYLFRIAAIAAVIVAANQLQAATNHVLTVAVPFDFVVSGKTLPAGTYTIISANTVAGASTFAVRNKANRLGALSIMGGRAIESKEPAAKAQVRFACRAGACYWHELRIPGFDAYVAPLPAPNRGETERMVALEARSTTVGR